MKIILAIGGSVIKTAHKEIKQLARRKAFDVLIHNGGSLFHDFQRSSEKLKSHSYTLDELMKDYKINRKTSERVWNWVVSGEGAPEGSLTRICEKKEIEVLCFSVLGGDFWHLFETNIGTWQKFAINSWFDFERLKRAMSEEFHFICMGSAVVHPEVFTKALAVIRPPKFVADVVDFKEMYRPRTRVAKYGHYYRCTHAQYLRRWLDVGRPMDWEVVEFMDESNH